MVLFLPDSLLMYIKLSALCTTVSSVSPELVNVYHFFKVTSDNCHKVNFSGFSARDAPHEEYPWAGLNDDEVCWKLERRSK